MYQTQKLTYLFDSLYAVNNICFWHYTKDWELLDTNCPWINEVRNFFFDSKYILLKHFCTKYTKAPRRYTRGNTIIFCVSILQQDISARKYV